MSTEKVLGRLEKFKTFSYVVERLLLCLVVIAVLIYAWTWLAPSLPAFFNPGGDDGDFLQIVNTDMRQWFFATYGEAIVVGALGVAIFHQVTKLFESALGAQRAFLPSHVRRLRLISLLFVALTVFLFLCSLVASALLTSGFPVIEVGFGDLGLPTYAEWWQAIGIDDTAGVEAGAPAATLNLLTLSLAVIIWGLSYLFEYGVALQDDADHTL